MKTTKVSGIIKIDTKWTDNKMKNEKQHYIPQFILKNFAINGDKYVFSYDVESKKEKCIKINSIFQGPLMYIDIKNETKGKITIIKKQLDEILEEDFN